MPFSIIYIHIYIYIYIIANSAPILLSLLVILINTECAHLLVVEMVQKVFTFFSFLYVTILYPHIHSTTPCIYFSSIASEFNDCKMDDRWLVF